MAQLLFFSLSILLLSACAPAEETAASPTPLDLQVIATSAVATIYADLTLTSAAGPIGQQTPIPPSELTPLPGQTPEALPASFTDKFGVEMRLVPAGPFLMSAGAQPDQQETLRDYYIDTYEVSNLHYMVCVHAGVCKPPLNPGSFTHKSYYLNPTYNHYPVISVSAQAAQAYCAWRGARLPSASEWEKAARGVDGRLYPWGGDLPDGTRANLCDRNCPQDWADTTLDDTYADAAPQGSFPAGSSPYGIQDMLGNVSEWVTTADAPFFAARGGSWKSPPGVALLTENMTLADGKNTSALDIGFRCAR